MTDREKMIDILMSKPYGYTSYDGMADYLLANGVIVPPCKVGDTVYEIDYDFMKGTDCVVESKMNGFGFLTMNSIYRIDSFGKTVFLSREEAEKALKGVE